MIPPVSFLLQAYGSSDPLFDRASGNRQPRRLHYRTLFRLKKEQHPEQVPMPASRTNRAYYLEHARPKAFHFALKRGANIL
jgi:hypothetical protein